MFGREVLPEFKERDDKLAATKAERLAPAVAAAMERKKQTPPPPAMDPGYAFEAMPRRMVDASGSKEGREWLEKFADDRAAGARDDTLGILG
jgi:hypothetical protein